VPDCTFPPVRTILFDLDGTLVDTAPDLAFALNRIREEEGLPDLPYPLIREQVSNGSAALIRLAFGDDQGPERFAKLKSRFLEIYQSNLNLDSCLFPGMAAVLAFIERRDMNWGVVTNKPAWLTDPLMQALGLAERSISTISGDTTDQRKPHPKPLLIACEAAGSTPAECIYVGDALRDIEAGRAAMMRTLVALYGYIDNDQRPQEWGADGLLEEPRELLHWLNLDDALTHPLAR